MQTHVVSESDISLSKDNSYKTLVSTYISPDISAGLDTVQGISRFLRKTPNIYPHTSHLQTQTGVHNTPQLWPQTWHNQYQIQEYFCLIWSGSWSIIRSWLWTANNLSLTWTISSQQFLTWFWKNDEGKKMSSQLWLRMSGDLNYILTIYAFILYFFTEKVRGAKTEKIDVDTYGGRIHVYTF